MKLAANVSLLLSVIIIIFCGCAAISEVSDVTDDESMVLRMAESYPREHPSAIAAQKFADLIYARSDGRIRIKVYYDGELGNDAEVLEQVQFGGIALARVNLLDLSGAVPTMQDYLNPFAYESPEEILNALYLDEEKISAAAQLEKLLPLVWYYPDVRCFYNNRLPLHSADDFQGLRLQTNLSQKMTNTIESMGATPVQILSGDPFQSLSSGFMDGGEDSVCGFLLGDVCSVVPYVTLSNYMYCPDMLVGSGVTFSKILREDQQLIYGCAAETFAYQKKALLEMRREGLQKLQEQQISVLEQHAELDESMRSLLFAQQQV